MDQTIYERNRLIAAVRKTVLEGELTARDCRKNDMAQFERDQAGLSRIEALYRLNRIQWICEVMEQMESYFKEHNNLDGWKYEMPYGWGSKDERSAQDF